MTAPDEEKVRFREIAAVIAHDCITQTQSTTADEILAALLNVWRAAYARGRADALQGAVEVDGQCCEHEAEVAALKAEIVALEERVPETDPHRRLDELEQKLYGIGGFLPRIETLEERTDSASIELWAKGRIAEQGREQAGEAVPRVGRDRGGRERGAQDDGRGSVGADAPRCSQPDLAKDEERCGYIVPLGAGPCSLTRRWHDELFSHAFVPREKAGEAPAPPEAKDEERCGYVWGKDYVCDAPKIAHVGTHTFVPRPPLRGEGGEE